MIATDMQYSRHDSATPRPPRRRRARRAAVALILGALAMEIGERLLVAQPSAPPVQVRVETELGAIVLELDPVRAPGTTANFLKYVDAGHYDGGTFHRTVKMDNQPESTVKIQVIQAGVNPELAKSGFPSIPLERTSVTGLKHVDGAVSMARGAPDSATSGWFICIEDQPSLDFGGARNPDGQGFAAFGRVVSGMDIVRRIQQAPSSSDRTTNQAAQRLTPPIRIVKVSRIAP
jgi:peptidyl-prolyl cis-trans isomerase A (cyclophilin A)